MRLLILGLLVLAALALPARDSLAKIAILDTTSPDGKIAASIRLADSGKPELRISMGGEPVATIGLDLFDAGKLEIIDTRESERDETYQVPVGKTSSARNHHHEFIVSFRETSETPGRFDVVVRVFDDGVAFRYIVPESSDGEPALPRDELTTFAFSGDPTAHALPLDSYTTSYEAAYTTAPVSKLARDQLFALPMLLEQTQPGGSRLWIALTEANLQHYSGMYLERGEAPGQFVAKLSPLPKAAGDELKGANVASPTEFVTPWRVLIIADDPGKLLESNIIFNLSDPSAIADTSWIKEGKTTFPWWNGYVLENVDFKPGMNTATHKHYIDFCAAHGIAFHSLDGTNDLAWYGGPIVPNGPTDITRGVDGLDVPELLRYAKEKGVRLRLWLHWIALKRQIDVALPLYAKWGVEGIMVDFMDRDDAEMVAFYHEIAEKAAANHLTVTLHGSYKPTGMERTWPNVLNFEAALNQEYDKWNDAGITTKHTLDIAMIRGLAGPTDYHLGGMRNVQPADFKPRNEAPMVQGTRAFQLALYIILENHRPMLCDYPEAYALPRTGRLSDQSPAPQPGLDFLAAVPTNWDETRVISAEFGDSLVIARRHGQDWYIGGIARTKTSIAAALPFNKTQDYTADYWLDDATDATNVTSLHDGIPAGGKLEVTMGENGGFVVKLTPREAPR